MIIQLDHGTCPQKTPAPYDHDLNMDLKQNSNSFKEAASSPPETAEAGPLPHFIRFKRGPEMFLIITADFNFST